jgi:hypothetical protein
VRMSHPCQHIAKSANALSLSAWPNREDPLGSTGEVRRAESLSRTYNPDFEGMDSLALDRSRSYDKLTNS